MIQKVEGPYSGAGHAPRLFTQRCESQDGDSNVHADPGLQAETSAYSTFMAKDAWMQQVLAFILVLSVAGCTPQVVHRSSSDPVFNPGTDIGSDILPTSNDTISSSDTSAPPDNELPPNSDLPADLSPPTWDNAALTAKPGNYQVELNWPPASDDVEVTAYRVFQDGKQVAEQADTKMTVGSLQPGTAYSFKVEAGDAGGNWSNDGPSAKVTTGKVWTPGPNSLDQNSLFQCAGDTLASSPSRVRRMERREWTHTVGKPLTGTW